MRKIIIGIALIVCLLLAGCGKDEEFVELRDVYSEGNVAELTVNSVSDDEGQTSANSDNSAEGQTDSLPIVVYICGEVNFPGVYELENGARVFDAINAAGGYKEGAYEEAVNLAQFVFDGQMINIPSIESVMEQNGGQLPQQNLANIVDITSGASNGDTSGSSGGTSGNSSGGAKVNINTASVSELTTIPGIGESKANKIISYRTEHGRFNSIEDIMNISGIKEGLFNKVKDYICVH